MLFVIHGIKTIRMFLAFCKFNWNKFWQIAIRNEKPHKISLMLKCNQKWKTSTLFIVAIWGWQLRAWDFLNNYYEYVDQITLYCLTLSGFLLE